VFDGGKERSFACKQFLTIVPPDGWKNCSGGYKHSNKTKLYESFIMIFKLFLVSAISTRTSVFIFKMFKYFLSISSIDIVSIIYGFTSRSRIVHLYGDVTIAGEGLQNLGLCSGGTSVFPVSSEGPPNQSPLTTHMGMWRIYSNPEFSIILCMYKLRRNLKCKLFFFRGGGV
jgi:hypothetical protein